MKQNQITPELVPICCTGDIILSQSLSSPTINAHCFSSSGSRSKFSDSDPLLMFRENPILNSGTMPTSYLNTCDNNTFNMLQRKRIGNLRKVAKVQDCVKDL